VTKGDCDCEIIVSVRMCVTVRVCVTVRCGISIFYSFFTYLYYL
jgi:hypothetical protein